MAFDDNSNWMSIITGRPVESLRGAVPPASVDEIPAARRAYDFSHLVVDLPELEDVRQVELWDRGDWTLRAEVLTPPGIGPFPTILYMHGGGWCVGSAAGVRMVTARLAAGGYVVVSLDYSLAPERPYPTAVEDVVYAARWVRGEIGRYGGDPARIVLAGDSAGANLAAVGALELRGERSETATLDEGDLVGVEVDVAGALLFSGIYDFPLLQEEPGSFSGWVEVWWNLGYLGPHYLRRHRDPLVSPVYSEMLVDMPPVYLSVGSNESLVGQTLSLAKKLCWQNTPTTLSVLPGQDHAFHYAERVLGLPVTGEYSRVFGWLADVTGRRDHPTPGLVDGHTSVRSRP